MFPASHGLDGVCYLPGFALAKEAALAAEIARIAGAAPFRQMMTPGGRLMSAGITACGAAGWISDRMGYRYSATDPLTGLAWPAMPEIFRTLAGEAAAAAGFPAFRPDCCLINRYAIGAKMSLHQDADERDFSQPIVSVSLGLPAVFLWGGPGRSGKTARLKLESGDVLVWGGAQRKFFHGILPVKAGAHSLTGMIRFNLTFRKAL